MIHTQGFNGALVNIGIPGDFKIRNRIARRDGHFGFQNHFALRCTGVHGYHAALLRRQNTVCGHCRNACVGRRFRRRPYNFIGQRVGNAPFPHHRTARIQAVGRNLNAIFGRSIVRNHRFTDNFNTGNGCIHQFAADGDFHRFGNAADGCGNRCGFAECKGTAAAV